MLNMYLENLANSSKGTLVAYSWPGFGLPVANLGDYPIRQLYVLEDQLYAVAGNQFYGVSSGPTALGSLLSSTGPVSIADSVKQILIVDGVGGYVYDTTTDTYAEIADANFPAGATAVAYQDGFFMANRPNSRQWYISKQYDGTVWTPVTFASKEQFSDNLISIAASGGLIRLFGSNSIEFWSSSGSLDFPFLRTQGATTYVGVLASQSISSIEGNFFFLGTSANGDAGVYWLQGTQVTLVSSSSVHRSLSKYLTLTDAVGQCMLLDGHVFYILSFPTQMETWLYDLSMSQVLGYPVWCKLASHSMSYYRFGYATSLKGKIIVGDTQSGRIYQIDPESPTENGMSVTRQLVSGHFYNAGELVYINEMQVDMEVGNTIPNAQILLEISKDGGWTYLPGQLLLLGGPGQYKTRVRARRLGVTRDGVFRLTVTDPVYIALLGANIE
jgi:hypothetical protein